MSDDEFQPIGPKPHVVARTTVVAIWWSDRLPLLSMIVSFFQLMTVSSQPNSMPNVLPRRRQQTFVTFMVFILGSYRLYFLTAVVAPLEQRSVGS